MWENSSAYSRVRFEDIAPKNIQKQPQNQYSAQQHLNINKHQILTSVNTNLDKNANKNQAN
jgi:hypothetical protein